MLQGQQHPVRALKKVFERERCSRSGVSGGDCQWVVAIAERPAIKSLHWELRPGLSTGGEDRATAIDPAVLGHLFLAVKNLKLAPYASAQLIDEATQKSHRFNLSQLYRVCKLENYVPQNGLRPSTNIEIMISDLVVSSDQTWLS